MAAVTHSQLGGIIAQHSVSLPRRHSDDPRWYHFWPGLGAFVGLPALSGALLYVSDIKIAENASAGLLAGVSVLAGLLFQVLASIGGRTAALADQMPETGPSPQQIGLLRRLDIARANVAYATLLSIINVTWLATFSLLEVKARWPLGISTFLQLHLAATLMLVLVRVNSIGQDDRIAALTRRATSQSTGP